MDNCRRLYAVAQLQVSEVLLGAIGWDWWRPEYVLTGDGIPFVQDGMRDGEHIRHAMLERFVEVLSEGCVPWVEVRGAPDERLRDAVARIDELLLTGWDLADPPG